MLSKRQMAVTVLNVVTGFTLGIFAGNKIAVLDALYLSMIMGLISGFTLVMSKNLLQQTTDAGKMFSLLILIAASTFLSFTVGVGIVHMSSMNDIPSIMLFGMELSTPSLTIQLSMLIFTWYFAGKGWASEENC